MAKKAVPEDEEVEMVEQPDFERAIKILAHDVSPNEEDNAKARGELSAAWKLIEDECHVNKKAAKDYHKLSGMSDEKRDDYLRSLYGMMKAGNIGISRDLVDRMGEGDAPTMPVMATASTGGLDQFDVVLN